MIAPQYKNGYISSILITASNYHTYDNYFNFLIDKKVRIKSPSIGTHVGIFKGTFLLKESNDILYKANNHINPMQTDYNYPVKYTNMAFNIKDLSLDKIKLYSINIEGLVAISILDDNPNDFGYILNKWTN